MLPVVWGTEALEELAEIGKFIAARSGAAADRIQTIIERTAEGLPLHPYMHRPGRVAGTREAVAHPNYIVVNRVGEEAIDILAVLHARQNHP